MDNAEIMLDEIQNTADYVLENERIKRLAKGSIIWGFVNLAVGIMGLQASSFNIILIILGILLLSEGIWILLRPKPVALIIDGLVFLILGGWNIFVTVLDSIYGGAPHLLFVFFGVLQLGWGTALLLRYKRFNKLYLNRQSETVIGQTKEIIDSIASARVENSDDIMELTTKKFVTKDWKCKLLAQSDIFVSKKKDRVISARKDDVYFKPKGKVFLSKWIKISGWIGKHRFNKGEISPDSMKHYDVWKAQSSNIASNIPPVA